MPSSRQPQAPAGLGAFTRVLRDPGRNLKERYKDDPLALAERLGVKLPVKPVDRMIELGVLTVEEAEEKYGPRLPGWRDLVYDVCTLAVTDAVGVGSRGSGKSFDVSFIEFFLWLLLDFDCLNLGGSELQADQVYRYLLNFLDDDPFWLSLVRGDPAKERTFSIEDAWVRVLTASQKSVRSPHAGGLRKGKMRGGILVIDEEAETDPNIVEAALPTINTARPSVNVRVSTFHNVEGSFAEVVDNHREMGYTLYMQDIFDSCEGCECGGDPLECEHDEECFREDHWEDYIDPETNEPARRLIHKAYCGGRAKYAEGHIPMREVTALWRRMRRNHSRWEVEAMGSRPSLSGHVLKDQVAFNRSIVSETGDQLYVPGAPCEVDVDWGANYAGVLVIQQQRNKHVILKADLLVENTDTQLVGTVVAYARTFRCGVAGDIGAGGGGVYFNEKLRREFRLPVRDVNFQTDKETAVAAWNIINEDSGLVVPEEHIDFIHQVRNWKRKNGVIQKGQDHLCDAGICYFSKFIDQLGISKVRVGARSFRTGDVRFTGAEKDDGPKLKSGYAYAKGTKRRHIPVTARTLPSPSKRKR